MTTYIRRGNDCLLYLKLKANVKFDKVKSSRIYLVHTNDNCSSEHKPTLTATNIRCNQKQPTSSIELSTGPIAIDGLTMTVDSLIPADLLVSGDYRLVLSWSISKELDSLKVEELTYTKDFTDTITVTNDSTDNTITNSITYAEDIIIKDISENL